MLQIRQIPLLAKLRGFDGHRHRKTILTFLRRRILCKAIGKYSNFKAYINGIFLYQVWLKTPFPKFVDHPASLLIIYIDHSMVKPKQLHNQFMKMNIFLFDPRSEKKTCLLHFAEKLRTFFCVLAIYVFLFFFYIWVLIVFLNNNSLYCNFGLFAHICLFTYRHLSDPALMAQSPGPPSSTHALTLSQSPSFTFGEKLW